MPDAERLLVIDAQNVFADPESPWGSPMFGSALPRILQRVEQYGERAILTRYVAPLRPDGAWVEYFAQWPFALVPPTDPLYALCPDVDEVARRVGALSADDAVGADTVDETTFGKWGEHLRSRLAGVESIEIVGVSTDCCVLSTALAVADAGIRVLVNAAGCAGSTPQDHDRALRAMALYGPLITIV